MNVRGLGERTKRPWLRRSYEIMEQLFFCLEETKLEEPSVMVEQELTLRRNFEVVFKKARGASGGIAIAVNRNRYKVLDVLPKEYTLTVIVKQRSDDWIQKITTTCSPNFRERRGTLWDEIRKIGRQDNYPWVIGGDFNVVRYRDEHKGGSECPK